MAHQKEKKKVNQSDLRRLMKERKENLVNEKPVESPLAKYDNSGRLSCIVCNEIIKSSSLWRMHILSKTHKRNVTEKFKRKATETADPVLQASKKIKVSELSKASSNYSNASFDAKQQDSSNRSENSSSNSSTKPKEGLIQEYSSSDNDEGETTVIQSKTGEPHVPPFLPPDFFDSNVKGTASHSQPSTPQVIPSSSKQAISNATSISSNAKSNNKQSVLPEGFFDDPVLDAQARNVVYKDPLEEEMEKFQKEIAEETNLSQSLMDEDIEQSATERSIGQIDEQMNYYSRVVAVQKKSEEIKESKFNESGLRIDDEQMEVSSKSSDTEDEDRLLEELSDWRAKKFC